jgi:hypothetical protein
MTIAIINSKCLSHLRKVIGIALIPALIVACSSQDQAGDLTNKVLKDEVIGKKRPAAHTSEVQSPCNTDCRLLLEKNKKST